MLKFRYSGGRFVLMDKSAAKQPTDNRTPVHVTVKVQSFINRFRTRAAGSA
jgi:hypothetical protein